MWRGHPPPATMNGMITVQNLTKRYGDHVAVDDVSFTCRPPGQVTGFLGPNGAGKSTTMRIIAGLTPPATSGVARLYGVDYHSIPNPPATQVACCSTPRHSTPAEPAPRSSVSPR